MNYRVKEGTHKDRQGRLYKKGDIVYSEVDLVKAFPGKFELVPAPAPVPLERPVISKPTPVAAKPAPAADEAEEEEAEEADEEAEEEEKPSEDAEEETEEAEEKPSCRRPVARRGRNRR